MIEKFQDLCRRLKQHDPKYCALAGLPEPQPAPLELAEEFEVLAIEVLALGADQDDYDMVRTSHPCPAVARSLPASICARTHASSGCDLRNGVGTGSRVEWAFASIIVPSCSIVVWSARVAEALFSLRRRLSCSRERMEENQAQ